MLHCGSITDTAWHTPCTGLVEARVVERVLNNTFRWRIIVRYGYRRSIGRNNGQGQQTETTAALGLNTTRLQLHITS